MAFNFSISITSKRGETFKVENAHSFDEALKLVEKGIYDRELEYQEKMKKEGLKNPVEVSTPATRFSGADSTQPTGGQSVASGPVSVASQITPPKE